MENITYSWKITSVRTRDEGSHTHAVVQTHWQKIGTDENGNTGTFNGATPFTSENVADDEFVPFEQLTEEIVLGWIKDIVVGSYEEHVNTQIIKEIQNAINPITDPVLPWQTPITGSEV